MNPPMQNPIFVALDVNSADEALRIAKNLGRFVGGFKLGPRLILPYGAQLVSQIAKWGPVFVDMKYLDIPNTMEAALRATFDLGATWTTVHAWAGQASLERLAKVEQELSQKRPFQVLAVTILTSFSQNTLPPLLRPTPIVEQVQQLARMACDAGLKGIVSSALELPLLQSCVPSAFKVVPGIRPNGAPVDDQARTLTPAEALQAGASALVIGRPIVHAPDPVLATEEILSTLGARPS